MTIEFQCTECGRPMRAPDGAAGKQGKCPQCGTVMPIPAPEPAVPRAQLTAEGKLQFPCPSCAAPVRTPAAAAGKRGKCPHCGDIMQIPLLDEQEHSPAPVPVPAPRPPVDTPARAAPTTKSTGTSAGGAMIEFLCTNCQNKMRAPAGLAGKNGKCPRCQTVVRIPGNSQKSGSASSGLTPLPAAHAADPFGGGLTPLPDSAGLTPLGADGGLTPLDDGTGLSPLSSPLGDLGGLTPLGAPGFPSVNTGGAANPFGVPTTASPFGPSGATSNPFGVSAGAGGGFTAPSTNPYAAPAYSPALGHGAVAAGGRGLDFGRAFSRTWEIFTPNIGQAILLTLTAGGMSALFGIGFNVLSWIISQIGVMELAIVFLVISAVVFALFTAYITVGLQYSCLRWGRTGKLNTGDFFRAGEVFLPVLAINFLVGLATMGLMLVGYLPGVLLAMAEQGFAAVLVMIVGVLLGGAAALVIGLKLVMAPYYCMDKRLGVIDAMGASYRAMTLANCAIFFLTMLVAGLAGGMVTAVTCYIGSLVVYPFLMLMVAVMYVQLADQGR